MVSEHEIVILIEAHIHQICSARGKHPDLAVLVIFELRLPKKDGPENLLDLLVDYHFVRATFVADEILYNALVLLLSWQDFVFTAKETTTSDALDTIFLHTSHYSSPLAR